jgi:DNA-3-methyladenine glycosylase I
MREKGEDFSPFIWSFVGGAPIQNHFATREDVPVATPQSEALSKALKQRGFKFVGPVIVYAFMQAVGMVNDHTSACFRYEELGGMAEE